MPRSRLILQANCSEAQRQCFSSTDVRLRGAIRLYPTPPRDISPSRCILVGGPIKRDEDMTEYELADAISSYVVQGGTFFTIWLTTTVSAYAVVAYTAGKSLSIFQTVWLNRLYLFAALIVIFTFHSSFRSSVYYAQKIRELNPSSPQAITYEVIVVITVIAAAGTIATLKFMWDIRHPKTE